MSALRNSKHELFCQEIAKGSNGLEAYQRAGYKANANSAGVNASRLLKDAKVRARVDELLAQRDRKEVKATERAIERTAVSKEWVIDKLRENVERAMTVHPVMRDGEPTGEFMYNGSVANKALELLGREIGMFIARSEVGKPGDFSELTDGELADRLVDELVRGGVPADVARDFARVQLQAIKH